jgi:hypothetical protein
MNLLLSLCLVVLLMGGCAGKQPRAPQPPDAGRVVVLEDGSRCTKPLEFEALRATEGAKRLQQMFDSEGKYEDLSPKIKDLIFGYGEIDAVFFESCKASQGKTFPKPLFERNRNLYLDARQKLLAEGIGAWLSKGSLGEAGKLCLFGFEDEAGDPRNFTRLVPGDTSVDDCARMSAKLGGNYVLLGCTQGKWENRWAEKAIKLGPWGAKDRRLAVSESHHVPKTNCAWN